MKDKKRKSYDKSKTTENLSDGNLTKLINKKKEENSALEKLLKELKKTNK